MQTFNETQIITLAKSMLQEKGLVTRGEIAGDRLRVEQLSSDGSTRRFWRCTVAGKPVCILAAPLTTSKNECKESQSAYYIGKHLYSKGCAVPRVYGWHDTSGMLLFEDLGDVRFHDEVVSYKKTTSDDHHLKNIYGEVIAQLIALQIQGGDGFDPTWCWDTEKYDRQLMLKKESGYFLDAFWTGLLGKDTPQGIEEELCYVADIAAKAPAKYFLHRDFQSRNIMACDNRYVSIDFQGGRLGPLGYDLASLLIDPYCGLSYQFQGELVDLYFREVSKGTGVNKNEFFLQYSGLALQRNLQILGAFAFLSKIRKKTFFVSYIKPALQTAMMRLEEPVFKELHLLRKMIETGLHAL